MAYSRAVAFWNWRYQAQRAYGSKQQSGAGCQSCLWAVCCGAEAQVCVTLLEACVLVSHQAGVVSLPPVRPGIVDVVQDVSVAV